MDSNGHFSFDVLGSLLEDAGTDAVKVSLYGSLCLLCGLLLWIVISFVCMPILRLFVKTKPISPGEQKPERRTLALKLDGRGCFFSWCGLVGYKILFGDNSDRLGDMKFWNWVNFVITICIEWPMVLVLSLIPLCVLGVCWMILDNYLGGHHQVGFVTEKDDDLLVDVSAEEQSLGESDSV